MKIFKRLPGWLAQWVIFILKKKLVIGVAAIVEDDRGRYLFLHHTCRKRNPWRIPGGLKEKFETPFATAVREMWEEANVQVTPIAIVSTHEFAHIMDIAVYCRLISFEPFRPNAEIDDIVWVDLNDPPIEIRPEEQKLLDAVAKFKRLLAPEFR